MKEQKVVITKCESTINALLSEGWVIESVTAQHVATGSGSHLEGQFCFVLHKPIEML